MPDFKFGIVGNTSSGFQDERESADRKEYRYANTNPVFLQSSLLQKMLKKK